MSTSSFSELGVGVLTSKFRLLLPSSMSPHSTTHPSPTMPSSSRSEKLLRDALLKDERERHQQLASPPGPTKPPMHRRRHSHIPTSSYSASTSSSKEDIARGSFLFRTAMSNPRSLSPSSVSQARELEPDDETAHIRRTLFYGSDVEGPQRRQNQSKYYQQQHRRSSPSPSPAPSRRSSASTSPSPSPLHMRGRQEGLGQTPVTHKTNTPPVNPFNTSNHHGSAYPSPSHGQGEPSPHEQVLRARLERALIIGGGPDAGIRMRRGDENEVRDEQGSCPWRPGRQNTGEMISGSIITTSSSASNSNSSHFQSNYPHTPQNQTRTYHSTTTPNRTTVNNNRSPHYLPSSPHTPFSAPGVVVAYTGSPSPSHTRSRSRTDPHPHSPPNSSSQNLYSPRRNNSIPNTAPPLPPASNSPGSSKVTRSNSKPTRKSPSPLLLRNPEAGESEEELRLPTPPPTPPLMARGDYVPSPYKTPIANPSPSSTLTRTPVRTQQTHRKKEAGLEMRRPTRGIDAEKEKNPLRPLDVSSASSRQRKRDVTITQQSQQALRPSTGPNPPRDPKKSNKNTDGNSSETCSTSGSSVSPLDGCTSGYCACSSHSSLDGPISTPPSPPFTFGHHSPHLVQHSGSNPPSPSPASKPFNARKASTQCRAIQGYVSFASVEGLGEPPLVRDEFDGDGFGEDVQGNGKSGKGAPFLPLSMWNAALGWKRFLGGAGTGHGEQGVVV